jgi:RNA polymerase sigma-70 factor (ECF subfamily)
MRLSVDKGQDKGMGSADEKQMESSADEEMDLLRRSIADDQEAFAEYVKLKRKRVYRIAARICGPDEADDVAQVVFLRLWKVLPGLKDLSKTDAWLTRVTVNRAIDMLRHIGRRLRLVISEKQTGLEKPDEDALQKGDLNRVFNRASQRIGERQRIAFVLREMEGFSSAETAELMAVEESTVRNLVMQARKGLRKALREMFPEYAPVEESKHQE